ncbi:NEDD4 family-interacting protein 1 isoform X1 [Callorhinchus milii]|uniref:NEDD4 family-interacting protein 1 isoform X1 n=1 Tax=Callorhinchus milii TaxID=7868 RepID=UPI00045740C7|nr:NEDD4 family-interacting protein 1 isoform X1 [Callorhinchus milii]|eukprot:gi/632968802/ref/XP_007900728.1/ PREDICTED: NEDD4 family-interacting protein 1-like isoform X1 [Callorhinchus milii]
MEFNGKPIIFCEYDDDFLVEDGSDEEDQLSLGDDCMFLLTFFIAFVFNWIGFFLSFCSTNTIAGRYGAISGFGLSLLKWILIVRFSDYFISYFEENVWLWWIFFALGFTERLSWWTASLDVKSHPPHLRLQRCLSGCFPKWALMFVNHLYGCGRAKPECLALNTVSFPAEKK